MHPWEEAARRGERMLRGFESRSAFEFVPCLSKAQYSQVTQWLTDYVVALTESFVVRSRFQNLAAWSVRNLCEPSQTEVRHTVVQFQLAARRCIESNLQLIRLKSVSAAIAAVAPIAEVVSESVRIQAGMAPQTLSRTLSVLTDMPSIEAMLQSLLEGNATEFFCASDYFLTQQEFVVTPSGEKISNGLLVPGLWSRLEPLGDLIARTGRQRIESRLHFLEGVRLTLAGLPLSASMKRSPKYAAVVEARSRLENAWVDMRQDVFDHPQSRLTDSCATLTQVYAAYGARPKLDWLNLPDDSVISVAKCLPVFLGGHQGQNLVDRICRSLRDLGALYDPTDAGASQQEDVIAAGGLVMIEDGREVYWDRQLIALGKGRRNWQFLWLLADRAATQRSVTEFDLFPDDAASAGAMPMLRHRLSLNLPSALDRLIETDSAATRAYRLHLESDRIRLIRRGR